MSRAKSHDSGTCVNIVGVGGNIQKIGLTERSLSKQNVGTRGSIILFSLLLYMFEIFSKNKTGMSSPVIPISLLGQRCFAIKMEWWQYGNIHI